MKIQSILDTICNTLALQQSAVISKCRKTELVHCRDIFANIAYKKGYKVREIATLLNRDVSSISYGRARFRDNMRLSDVFKDKVKRCDAAFEM